MSPDPTAEIILDIGLEQPGDADLLLVPSADGRFGPGAADDFATSVRLDRAGTVTVQTAPGLPHPLFHACAGGRLIIGRTIAAVRLRLRRYGIAAPLDPERTALTLCMDAMVGGMTPFAGIDTAGMGERLVFRPPYAGPERTVTWTPVFDDPDLAGLSFEAAVDRMAEVLGNLKVPGGPVLLPLSGGLDSRLLAGLASRAGAEIVSYTFRRGPSFERDCAVRVARRLGARHLDIDLPLDCYDGFADAQVRAGGGALTPMHVHNLFATTRLPEKDRALPRLIGYFGDPVAGDFQSWPAVPMEMAALARGLITATARNSTLFPGPTRNRFTEILAAELDRRAVQPHRRWEAAALILRQQGLITHLFAALETAGPVHRPFVDPAYIVLGIGLPPAFRHRRRAFVAAAERLFPDLFALPSTRLPTGLPGLLRRADMVVSKGMQRLSYALMGPERGWRSRYTYEQQRSLLAGPLRPKLLDAHARVADFLGVKAPPPDLSRGGLATAFAFRVLAVAALLEED